MFKKGHVGYARTGYQKILFICSICDKEFFAREDSKRKYCSRKCKVEAIRRGFYPNTGYQKGHLGYSKTKHKKILFKCLVCEKEFIAKENSGRKFCSRQCANKINPQNQKGHLCSRETSEKISKSLKGKESNFKGKTLIEIMGIERGTKELIKRRENPFFKGKHHTLESRKIIGESKVGKPSPHKGKTKENNLVFRERIEKMKITKRRQFQDQNYKEKILEKMRNPKISSPNKDEIYFEGILNENYPNEWKFVGDGYTWIAGKNPDYLNINGKKALIELFGCYYHGCPMCFPKLGDRNNEHERTEHYQKYGFKCLIIWGHELKDIDKILIKVQEFINA